MKIDAVEDFYQKVTAVLRPCAPVGFHPTPRLVMEAADERIAALELALKERDAEIERLRDGLVRIVQCHNYPMTITAEDVATGEVGPHGVDGCNCSDVLRIVHELLDAAAHPPESKPEGAWRDTACRDCCEGDRDCDDYPCPQIKGGTDG